MYDHAMAAAYDRGRRLTPQDIAAWMAAARPFLPAAGGTVLDLGAGTGRFTAALAETAGATVIAAEPSAAMRAVFRANCPGVPLVAGTAQAAPFATAAFDAIWASMVIHHVTDLPALAANARRTLKPGGCLLLRGGFGPPSGLLLHRYFPGAWSAGSAVTLSLPEITAVLTGLDLIAHGTVEQVFAETPDELVARVRSRTLSNLAALPDPVFQRGLQALESDARTGVLPARTTEHLDLAVFRNGTTAPSGRLPSDGPHAAAAG